MEIKNVIVEPGKTAAILEHLPLESSLDTETTGFGAYKEDHLFSVIVSSDEANYYFNYLDYPDENIKALPRRELAWFKHELENPNRIWFMQNAKFDMHMLAREGIFIAGKIYDTWFLDRIEYNQHLSYSLDNITKRWGTHKLDTVSEYITEHKLISTRVEFGKEVTKKYYDKVPFSLMSDYGMQDGAGTLLTGKRILASIKREDSELYPGVPKQMQVVENESKLVHTLFRMEHRGIKLDIPYVTEAYNYFTDLTNQAMNRFKTETGVDFVKGTSVFEEVFKSEEHKWEKTLKGNWKWDSDALLAFDNPAAKIVIEYAESKKQLEYFQNFLFYADRNGILHPDFQQAGTVTGRLSCREPNLQNLTNPDKYESENEASLYPVRRSFIPREGYFFAMPDYSQVEFRVFLDMASANGLINEVLKGLDVHTATANVAGVTRKEAKTANFLCIAEGQLVLTNEGLVPIELVTATQKVWDGIEWVTHQGVIYKGEMECIEYDGLIATADHEVFTAKGWKVPFGYLARQQDLGRLVVTEDYGRPIRYFGVTRKYSKAYRKSSVEAPASWVVQMQILLKRKVDKLREYLQGARENVQMHDCKTQRISAIRSASCSETATEIHGSGNTLLIPAIESVSQLRWARDTGEMHIGRMAQIFFGKLFHSGNSKARYRSNEQRGALRDREHASCNQIREPKKSKKKVYDIVNAGPRHRFTVSGKLVSNCVYGGGVVALAQSLYDLRGNRAQLGCVYKEMFKWRLSDEEQQAKQFVTRELREYAEPIIQKAYTVQQSIFRAAPEIKDFIKSVQRTAETRGYIRNWLGRRYYFSDKRFSYKSPNHLIQGASADVLKVAMNRVDDYLLDKESKMLLTIHDELILEVKYGEEYVVDEVARIMESVYPYKRLPLLTDVEYSTKNLADKLPWANASLKHATRDGLQEQATP